MGQNFIRKSALIFCYYLVCYYSFAVNPDSKDLKRDKLVRETENKRQAFIEHALQYVGITEKTGRNDGKEIERFQRVVGIPPHSAYCTAFVSTMFFDLNIPAPITGYSPNMFTGNVIYRRKTDWRSNFTFPQASVLGFYYKSKGRIAHTGINEYQDDDELMTIQANTSFRGAVESDDDLNEEVREGEGIARKWVAKQVPYVVADYIGGPLLIYDWRKSGVYTKLRTIKE